MTFKELLNNPVGKGTGNVAARYTIINDLKRRMALQQGIGGFELTVYDRPKGEGWILFFKVMSEKFYQKIKLYYDTVIEIIPSPEDNSNSILESEVKVMTNMPSFAFTYAYVAKQKGMTIPWLERRFPAIFWQQAPENRNPDATFGFEKSIMFVCYWLQENKYHFKKALKDLSKGKANLAVLLSKFMPFEKKLEEYKEAQKQVRELQKKSGFRVSKNRKTGKMTIKVQGQVSKSTQKARIRKVAKASLSTKMEPKRPTNHL